MLLSFKNYTLTLKENNRVILKDINIDFLPGEIYCIFGPSGSGKTTMLNAILKNLGKTHEYTQKGEITLNNTDIQAISTDQYFKLVSAVMQNPQDQFFFPKTIYEYSFPLLNAGLSGTQTQECFDSFAGHFKLKNQDVFTLSAGEKQVLEIYANLDTDKQIYIYDEPLANLDRDKVLEFFTKLNHLKKAGKTIVIFEHRSCLLRYLTANNFVLKNAELKKFDFSCFSKIAPLILTEPLKDIALSAKNLSVKLGSNFNFLLKELNLNKGELKLITGDNGSGKTTIFNLLLGNLKIDKPSKIEVYLNKRKYKNLKKIKKHVSYLPHDVRYMFSENKVVKELTKVKNQTFIKKLLFDFGLNDKLNQHPFTLSHGEQQRLGLLLALAKEPKFLLLDEPTSGLDDELCFTICKAVANYMNTYQASTLIITHDPRVKAYFKVDEVVISKPNTK